MTRPDLDAISERAAKPGGEMDAYLDISLVITYARELEAENKRLREDCEKREQRRIEILDFLQDQLGTAFECDSCGHSSYHAVNNECEECGAPFPLANLIAFKLHASWPGSVESQL